MYDQERS
jgi:chromosome segregation ATPase